MSSPFQLCPEMKKPFPPIKDEKGSRGATLVISALFLNTSRAEITHFRYGLITPVDTLRSVNGARSGADY